MKVHQVILKKTEAFLKRHLGNKLNIAIEKYDDGYKETHLSITDTDFRISCDDRELTIGNGFNHQHFNPEYDDINEIIEILLNSLTKRKRITEYYKSKFFKRDKKKSSGPKVSRYGQSRLTPGREKLLWNIQHGRKCF